MAYGVVSVFVVPLTSSSLDGVDLRQQSGLCVELDYYVLHDTVKGMSLDFERTTKDQQEEKKQPACFFCHERACSRVRSQCSSLQGPSLDSQSHAS